MSRIRARATSPSKKKRGRAPPAPGGGVVHRTTPAALAQPALEALPPEVRVRYDGLRKAAPHGSKLVVAQIAELVEAHPEVPQFLNLLSVAHSAARNRAAAEECIRLAFERHPGYVFARLNYAELLLSKGELDRVPEVLGTRGSLHALYPEREFFHVAEVVPFLALTAEYLFRVGRPAEARAYLRSMQELAPKDPATRRIARLLRPPLFERLRARLG